LRRGDLVSANYHIELTDERLADNHTMAWHQRHRVLLLRSRSASAAGDLDTAAACAERLELDAERRGAGRYLVLARLQGATVAATVGQRLDHEAVDAAVTELAHVAGIDAWLIAADLASRSGVERWWASAEAFAAAFERAAARDPRTDVVVLHELIAREFQRRGR